jgi:hypothetical protein
MSRIFFLVSLLIIALPVLGQPVIEKVEGPFQAGESLSILGSGFGETPMDPSAVQGDTPLGSARVFLSNSATYPESATLAQAGQNALDWRPDKIQIEWQPRDFSQGEDIYLYVVDPEGNFNPKGFLLPFEDTAGKPGTPVGPGIPGKPRIVN